MGDVLNYIVLVGDVLDCIAPKGDVLNKADVGGAMICYAATVGGSSQLLCHGGRCTLLCYIRATSMGDVLDHATPTGDVLIHIASVGDVLNHVAIGGATLHHAAMTGGNT